MKRIILFITSVLFVSVAFGQVPGTLSYQGILVDGTGAPLADGTHYVKFYFYDDPTLEAPANLKYSSDGVGSGNSVTTFKGMFTFIIGSGSAGNTAIPSNIFSSQLYVKVVVDVTTTLTPKIALSTVPYAMISQTIVDNAVTSAKITDATIVAADLATSSVTSAKILDGDIMNADINAAAAIVDTKLATISTAGKVSGAAISGAMSGTLSGANITGSVAVANGGTGATTAAAARTNLGLGSVSTLSAIGSTEITDGTIVNADISGAAAITDSKLATITTPGKVSADAITSGTLAGSLVGTGISATNVTTGTLPASVIPASVASGSGTSGQIGFWNGTNTLTGDAGHFWDNTNKRLGLGTIVPSRRLHIVGTGGLDDDIVMESNASGANGGVIRFTRSQGTFAAPTSALANDELGSLLIAGHNGTAYTNAAEISSKAETLFSTAASAYLGFSTAAAGVLSEKMRITSSGGVGIGTTAPAAGLKLDVNGTSVFRGYTAINRTTPIGSSLFDIDGTVGASTYLGMYINGSNASSFPFYGYATAGVTRAWTYYDGAAGSWKLNIGTDRITVNGTNGNVGIGTISPQNKLDVEGGMAIGQTYSGTSVAPIDGLIVEGPVGIGTAAPGTQSALVVYSSPTSTLDFSINVLNDYNGALPKYGLNSVVSSNGTGGKWGFKNSVSGLGGNASTIYGVENAITPNGTGAAYGINSSISNIGTGFRYGFYNDVAGSATNTSAITGVDNIVNAYGTSTMIGVHNYLGTVGATGATGTRTGTYNQVYGIAGASNAIYGDYNYVQHLGTGTTYGVYADVNKSAGQAGSLYGLNITTDNDGTGNSYLMAANSIGATTGTEYGLYVTGEDINYFSGKVGIGTSSPDSYGTGTNKVVILGTGYISGGVWATSDIRYKEDFVKLSGALDKIKKLDGVSFLWKTKENPELGFPSGRQYGFKAQEVEKFFPELVATGKDGFKSMNYDGMTPVLLEAVKEQQTQIEELKSKVEDLQSQLAQYKELSSQIEELKKLITNKDGAAPSQSTLTGSIKK